MPPLGSTSASITPNTPQPLTATVVDVNNNIINGLALTYTSTNPASIGVSSTGAVTAQFPSTTAITAVCQPISCNPAPINVRGTLGTGVPIVSNSVQITSPGRNSNYIWVASPSSPYFVPIDLTTNTIGTPLKLRLISRTRWSSIRAATTSISGSYRELMIYSAITNTLTSEVPSVPGVVLAVSPSSSTVLVNDQNRGVFYLYSLASAGSGASSASGTTASFSTFGGIGQRAVFSPDGQTLYIVGQGIYSIFTTPLPAGRSKPCRPRRPARPRGSAPSTIPAPFPTTPTAIHRTPPAIRTMPTIPSVRPIWPVTIPSAAVFLSGSPTSAYGYCPDTTVTPVVNNPLAGTVGAASDHVATTTDGKHILGVTANPWPC